MWYLIALFVVLLIIVIWWMRRPLYHRNIKSEEFKKYLGGFLSQCSEGSLMFIEHEDSDRFVQFAKYQLDNSRTILHFGFPDAPWSRQYFDTIVNMLQTLDISHKITTGEAQIQRFVEVDLVLDDLENTVSIGARIAQATFEVMGLTENARFKIHYRGDLSPEAARSSLETLREQPNRLVRTLSRYYLRKLSDKKKSRDRGQR